METIFVRRKVNGRWITVEIPVRRNRKKAIIDRLKYKHRLQVQAAR